MVDAAVSFCLERIADFLLDETQSLINVHENVEEMKTELELLQAFLKDAEAKEDYDERVRLCNSMIKDVVCDAEDCIETFALERQSTIGGNINPILRYKLKSDVDALTLRISKLKKNLENYGVNNLVGMVKSSDPNRRQLLKSYSHIPELDVVGLEKDTDNLVEKLVSNSNECPVVSICGMGGLGKTTLAKQVYHHLSVKNHFTFCIWVYVSQECKKREIWEKILFKLTSPDKKKREEIAEMKDEELAKVVYGQLGSQKCLVVLDDIWEIADWKCLSPAFPLQTTESMILLTSRSKELAISVHSRGFVFEPQILDEADSWKLFQKKISSDLIGDTRKEMLAEDMVRQCKGLPLAIVVLVGILQANDDWNEVHENLKSHLKRRQDDRGELIIDVLALSYDYLPRHLKPCFLYLGLFPYDSDISVERVINLWVAEGIILSSVLEENEVLEDVAYRYLLELVQRYMVQVEKRDPTGRIGICHMHDLMLDMCLSKAKDKDFFRIINLNFRNNSFVTNEAIAPHRIRRIAVHLNNFNGKVNVQYSSYRSILGFSLDGASGISQPFIESMVDNFKLLRVFDLEGVQGFAIPRNIKNLIHLRLLNVNSAWVGRLPSIGNFRYLLTLNLDPYDSAEEIPDVIWKLERLRHLYLPRRSGAKTKSLRLANLKDLQTLVNFPAPVANLEDLTTLPSLRKLVIRIADTITLSKLNKIFQAQGQARNKFIHLRSLSVYCSGWNVDMKPIRWKYDQMDVNFELDGALEDEKQIAGCCPWLCISRQKSESTSSSSSERQDINQIISCCPRLYVLMINGNIVYQI